MTKLIVSLDCPNPLPMLLDLHRAGVDHFKLNVNHTLNTFEFSDLISYFKSHEVSLFMDLKIYNTYSEVQKTSDLVFNALGAEFLTVYADPKMLEAAYSVKSKKGKVLKVDRLTDGSGSANLVEDKNYDGLVCSVGAASIAKTLSFYNKIVVCPGIRLDNYNKDEHVHPYSPRVARNIGVDYIVVGRPIIKADNPIVVAKQIIDELKGV